MTETATKSAQIRGKGSEPIELAPGIGAREMAREVELERWAWRRVKALRFFYTHLTLYAIVNFIILLIDVSTPGDPWFYQVLLGWGLFVGLHAAYTYELLPWSSRDWEQRKVQELIAHRRERLHRR
ncbi:MAG TPA: 2TM domain-containing protein [Alphaproteobacteria bacterium]|nr:2TM domain-containing protein [Alphaproteobacteria bacterium]